MRSLRPMPPELQRPWGLAGAILVGLLLALSVLIPQPARAIEVLALFALLGAAGWSGWRVSGAVLPFGGIASRLVCAGTIAVAMVTCSATALGHAGLLRLGPFALAIVLCFAASLYLQPVPLPSSAPVAPLRWRSRGGIERVLLLAAAAALALRLGGSLVHVARDPGAFVAYDDVSYHLPAAAVWNRSGDLRTLKFETGDPSPTFYPLTAELSAWALLAPFHDCDAAALRLQLFFAAGSLVAVAALAQRFGLNRRGALLAVLLYATIDRAFPVLALGAGNDHAAAFFTLASLDAGLELLRRPSHRTAAYAGAALGLLIGTKYIGLFFAATVIAALLLLGLLGLGAISPAKDPATDIDGGDPVPAMPSTSRCFPLLALGATLCLTLICCGGYAYARNAWTSGNPVFPAPLSILGHRIWAGSITATLAWRRHLPEFSIDTLAFLTRRADLFGPLFAWTLLPAALAAPAIALARRDSRATVLFALPAILFLQFRFLMHDHRDLRYILPALALAAIATAWLLAHAGRRLGPATRSLVLAGVLLAASSHLHAGTLQLLLLLPLLCGMGVLAATAAMRLHPASNRHRAAAQLPTWRRAAAGMGLAAAIAAAWPAGAWLDHFQAIKLARQPAAAALDGFTSPRGAPVAYVGSNQPYFYFGSRLQNDLQIVPTDADLAAQYYTWGGTPRFPFDHPSLERWRTNLAIRHIAYVVAARTRDEGPERAWMAATPQDFALLYRTGDVEIWRVDSR
jgi:hypothetical protein